MHPPPADDPFRLGGQAHLVRGFYSCNGAESAPLAPDTLPDS